MTVTGDRVWYIWLTAYSEPVDHAVTDEDMAAGRGEYRAVCRAVFLPAAMESPPKPACPACLKALQSHMTVHHTEPPTSTPTPTPPAPAAARPRRRLILRDLLRPSHRVAGKG
jgi:hypothetical protein